MECRIQKIYDPVGNENAVVNLGLQDNFRLRNCNCTTSYIIACCLHHHQYLCQNCQPRHHLCEIYMLMGNHLDKQITEYQGSEEVKGHTQEETNCLINSKYIIRSLDHAFKLYSICYDLILNHMNSDRLQQVMDSLNEARKVIRSDMCSLKVGSGSSMLYNPLISEVEQAPAGIDITEHGLCDSIQRLVDGKEGNEEQNILNQIQNFKDTVYDVLKQLRKLMDIIFESQIKLWMKVKKGTGLYDRNFSEIKSAYTQNLSNISEELNELDTQVEARREEKLKTGQCWTLDELNQISKIIPARGIISEEDEAITFKLWCLSDRMLSIILNKNLKFPTKNLILECHKALIKKDLTELENVFGSDLDSLLIDWNNNYRRLTKDVHKIEKFFIGVKIDTLIISKTMISLEEDIAKILEKFKHIKHIIFKDCSFSGSSIKDLNPQSKTDTVDIFIRNPSFWFKTYKEFVAEFDIEQFPKKIKKIRFDATVLNRK